MASKRKQDQTEQLRRRIVAFHRVLGRDLRAHPANARRHPAVQREAFAAMMARIGQAGVLMAYRDPEAPDKLTLYDGHLRSEDFAEAVWDVAETDLTPDEAAEMLLSFDLVGTMAEYHAGALASLRDRAGEVHEALRERVEAVMAEAVERDKREAAEELAANAAEDPGAQEDRADELRAKWGVERGQVWRIGRHRVMCGDSTSAEDVTRLMAGERARLFATDPPYLVDYDGTNHPHKWNEPDANKDWSDSYHDWDDAKQGEALYDGFVAVAVAHAITEDAAWYCWHASRNQAMLERVWERYGAFVHQQIIWVKDRPILTRSWYMWQHEPCFFGWVKGQKPPRASEDYPASVWTFPTVPAGERTDHPTSKPVELFAIPMAQHTRLGEVCYEPFSGSGSQQVAGEQHGRLVYGLELQPQFVAVILERLAGMGLEPVLVNESEQP